MIEGAQTAAMAEALPRESRAMEVWQIMNKFKRHYHQCPTETQPQQRTCSSQPDDAKKSPAGEKQQLPTAPSWPCSV